MHFHALMSSQAPASGVCRHLFQYKVLDFADTEVLVVCIIQLQCTSHILYSGDWTAMGQVCPDLLSHANIFCSIPHITAGSHQAMARVLA